MGAMRIPEVDTLWQSLAITPVPADALSDDPCLVALRHIYTNGGAELRVFDLSVPPLWETHAAHNNLEGLGFPTTFLTLPAVWEALPTGVPRHPPEFHRHDEPLEDTLTMILLSGGAYVSCDLPPDEAEEAAIAFCEALFGVGNESVSHYACFSPWQTWLQDVAWDYTFVSVDRQTNRVWVLMFTDTD